MAHSSGFLSRHSNIYIYVPNLIGYGRIACALYAFAVAMSHPGQCVVAYFIGFVLDETDGRAARTLNQTSTLGTVLDMVTDRLATAGLLTVLCMIYPKYYMAFLSLVLLDIFSHWFQMYSTFVSGSLTHKDTKSKSRIVRAYYKYRMFMGYCCISCEVLYLSIYLLHWQKFWDWPVVPVHLRVTPELAHLTGQKVLPDLPLALALAVAALPGFGVKQVINCFQLKVSMQKLVAFDLERENRAKTL